MKPKQLESELQRIEDFRKPKQNLEQYATTPLLASRLLHCASVEFDDIRNKTVIDLGCGTGVLSIGAQLMGAKVVIGFDCDRDAIEQCKENMDLYDGFGSGCGSELVMIDVVELIKRYDCDDDDDDDDDENNNDSFEYVDYKWPKCDTVLTNPPFGTRRKGADVAFLAAACKMAKCAVYSFHKTSTREYVRKVALKKLRAKSANVVAELKYTLKNQYAHHRKDEVDVLVDVWRIEPLDDSDITSNNVEESEKLLKELAKNIDELQLSNRERKDRAKLREKNSTS